jgi:8-oxo-dGTP pyrophosphatase MutT (NUDIX family)
MISLIREKLRSHTSRRITGRHYGYAGVIMPLFEMEGETHILLTRRSDQLRSHGGEVSFPGGMCEDDDKTTQHAALRECSEEIGVKESDVEVIGTVDDEVTVAGVVITPYVSVIPYPYEFVVSKREVAYLIFLPLSDLLESNEYSSMYVGDDYIWGATWGMLSNLKNLLRDNRYA